jgi:hypothetical protein
VRDVLGGNQDDFEQPGNVPLFRERYSNVVELLKALEQIVRARRQACILHG